MPNAVISKRVVDAAVASDRDLFLWDSELRGFGLKVTPSGSKSYVVQYRVGGRGSSTKRWTIGTHGSPWTPDQARREARRILGLVAGGRDPVVEKRAARDARKAAAADTGRSVKAVGERWIVFKRQRGDRRAEEAAIGLERYVYPDLGDRPIERVARADAYWLYDRLAAKGRSASGHIAIARLKALLGFATERELIPANPLHRIKLPKTESRSRILLEFHPDRASNPAELLAIWSTADRLREPRRTFVKILILTAQRLNEVAGMQWAEIDGSRWRIPKERHKGKRGHDVPLSEQAQQLIEAMPRLGPNVFCNGRARCFNGFSALKRVMDRESGIEGWRWHDVRRSAASWIQIEFGVETMQDVLGHSMGGELVRTYGRGSPYQRRAEALAAWAEYVTGAPVDNVVVITARR